MEILRDGISKWLFFFNTIRFKSHANAILKRIADKENSKRKNPYSSRVK